MGNVFTQFSNIMSGDEEDTKDLKEEEEVKDESPPATEDAPPDAAEVDDAAPAEPPAKKKRTPKPKKPVEAPKVTKSGYPRTADMIIYAIESLAERKGSSVQGIKNFILKTSPPKKKKKKKKKS